jgi:hypothetical protein
MLLSEYLPTSCDTSGLAGLTKQVASMLLDNLPAGEVLDISPNVVQAGATTIPFLQTEAATALIAAINEKGEKPHLVHAVRVLPQQYAVHFWITHNMGAKCGVTMAANPGASPHERGIAVDLQNHEEWIEVLAKHNWIWRGPKDKPHFNYHGGHDPDFGIKGITAFQKLWNSKNPGDQIGTNGIYGPETEKRLEASPIAGFP